MSFRAKYPGTCPDCGDDIEIGDLLDWNADETAAVHHTCAVTPGPIGSDICPRCNVELPLSGLCGVCDPTDQDGAA